jgi:SAM-dependent methyltransferase
MQGLGWKVLGIEPDRDSAALAERAGIPIFRGTLRDARLPEASVAQVTFQHVLEHLPDPMADVAESHRILTPGGRLVLYTPNIGSLGHRAFREAWRALEPPRHLQLLSAASLRGILARSAFRRHTVVSVSKSAGLIFDYSVAIRDGSPLRGDSVLPQRGRRLFALVEALLCGAGFPVGEELEAVAWK